MQLTSYFMVKEAKYVVEGWAQSSDKLSAKKKNADLHILSISYSTNLVGHIILKGPFCTIENSFFRIC